MKSIAIPNMNKIDHFVIGNSLTKIVHGIHKIMSNLINISFAGRL